jgi:segregation and condensation protein A
MVDVNTHGLSAQNTESAFPEGGFVVELDRFQGPLDLLLHLIREQNIDIFDIPISQITRQFLAAIGDVDKLGLDRAGEFLEMAALLIRIKAQMLMPRRVDASGELVDLERTLRRLILAAQFLDHRFHGVLVELLVDASEVRRGEWRFAREQQCFNDLRLSHPSFVPGSCKAKVR